MQQKIIKRKFQKTGKTKSKRKKTKKIKAKVEARTDFRASGHSRTYEHFHGLPRTEINTS